MISFYALSGLINGITSVFLGIFVLLKNKKRKANQLFSLFCLAVAEWGFCYFFWPNAITKDEAFFWFRALHIGAILIPIFYLHFIAFYLDLYDKRNKIVVKLGYFIAFIFLCSDFTNLFIKDMVPKFSFRYWAEPGIFYHFFLIYFFSYAFYTLSLLFRKYKKSFGAQKAQIKYLLLGTIIGYLGGSTNYPLWYNINIPPVGTLAITLYVFLVAYAILRYRLMDIRVAMGRTGVYLLSFSFTIGSCFALMFFNSRLVQPISQNVFLPLIIITAVLFYQLFFKIFEKIASRFFYYSFYSSQKVLTELGKKLVGILDISELSNDIAQTLMSTMKIDRAVVLLREKTGLYVILKNIGFKEENGISLVKDSFLTEFLQKTQKPLVFEELSLAERDSNTEKEKTNLRKLQDNMKKIEAIVCLPLLRGKNIIGIIILGKKMSGDSYSQEDMCLLTTLANQAAIAIENAKLYDEVQDLSQNLQEKVDEQTKELQKAFTELQKIDKAKSEFISMASHQLRTPLTAVKGYLSMIREGDYGETTKQMQRPMASMALSVERLTKLVNDLLDISKIEMGNMPINKKPIKIKEVLQSCFDELKIKAKEKNLGFVFQKPKEKLPDIMVDELAIRQIVLNLLDNAIRYTIKGKVVLSAEINNKNILIKIQDTGRGITKQEIPNLFKSFARGSAGTDLFIEGTGLGLCVAKKYVDLHHGKIWAESPGKDQGTIFYIELPVK